MTSRFFKRLLDAVLASAMMFHGPEFLADPKPLKKSVRGGDPKR